MAEISKQNELSEPVLLTASHGLTKFNSGQSSLDDWLRNYALISEGKTARTYVVCDKASAVVGYYCISMGCVERGALPSKLKRARGMPNQIPVAIIGRLARDNAYRGKGLGLDLLQDALIRILSVSKVIGVRAVLVHALDDEAAEFWKQNEFSECPIGSGTFFLSIETIVNALS